MRARGIAFATVVLVSFGALATPAGADTFKVTKTGDPAPGSCSKKDCTLREAALASNDSNGRDTIVLKSKKTYTLAIPGVGEDLGEAGDLDLTGPVSVKTTSNKSAKIDASAFERAFDTAAALSLKRINFAGGADTGSAAAVANGDLTLERVEARGSETPFFQDGEGDVKVTKSNFKGGDGAIREAGEGAVDIRDSKFSGTDDDVAVQEGEAGNVTIRDTSFKNLLGGVATESDGGSLEASDSEMDEIAGDGFFEFGGGSIDTKRLSIRGIDGQVLVEFDAGSIRMDKGKVSDAADQVLVEFEEGDINVSDSKVSRTDDQVSVEFGAGGIKAADTDFERTADDAMIEFDIGDVTAKNVTMSRVGGNGLAQYGDGNINLTRSTLDRTGDQGIFQALGDVKIVESEITRGDRGGIDIFDGKLEIRDSTIADNSATFGAGIEAGSSSRVSIENSTISGNESSGSSGGIALSGASSLDLNAVTIVRNQAASNAGGILLSDGASSVKVRNSIVGLNSALTSGPDCFALDGQINSKGRNLISDDTDCPGFDGKGDRVKSNLKLGNLANNGGPTRTIALKSGSPAIGKAGKSAPKRDQRGRKRDSKPDIGAFER